MDSSIPGVRPLVLEPIQAVRPLSGAEEFAALRNRMQELEARLQASQPPPLHPSQPTSLPSVGDSATDTSTRTTLPSASPVTGQFQSVLNRNQGQSPPPSLPNHAHHSTTPAPTISQTPLVQHFLTPNQGHPAPLGLPIQPFPMIPSFQPFAGANSLIPPQSTQFANRARQLSASTIPGRTNAGVRRRGRGPAQRPPGLPVPARPHVRDSLIIGAPEPTARITVKIYPPKVRSFVSVYTSFFYLLSLTTGPAPRIRTSPCSSRLFQCISDTRKSRILLRNGFVVSHSLLDPTSRLRHGIERLHFC